MGYEVDFLDVGKDTERDGDAICIRYGDLCGPREAQRVVIIDGGYARMGPEVVNHVRERFGTRRVDLAICTHPDRNHFGGLAAVLEMLDVRELWVHKPWNHHPGLSAALRDVSFTEGTVGRRLKSDLHTILGLCETAARRGTAIREPFTGLRSDDGVVTVLGPSRHFYQQLLPRFDGLSPPVAGLRANPWSRDYLATAREIRASARHVQASWGRDLITDEDKAPAAHNASVITQLIVDDHRLVFTGCVGIAALHQAADQLERCTSPAKLTLFQIPCHGSSNHVGPSILSRIVGPVRSMGDSCGVAAIASMSVIHAVRRPHKSVLNAFTHRGAMVRVTRGKGICVQHDAPRHADWGNTQIEPYYWFYEEDG